MQPRKIFFIILLFASQLNYGQTYSSLTTDKEIYDFLNWLTKNEKKFDEAPFFKKKKVYYKILHWSINNLVWKDTTNTRFLEFDRLYLFKKKNGLDTIFNKSDRVYLLEQFKAIKNTTWQKQFRNSKMMYLEIKKKSNNYYYSVPLFSKDKKYVIIRRFYFCGHLCGYFGYYIYIKISKNKWKFLKCINEGKNDISVQQLKSSY